MPHAVAEGGLRWEEVDCLVISVAQNRKVSCMESFLWTTAAALVAGLATVAWKTPRLYLLLPLWVMKTLFFMVIGGFLFWDYAIRFDNAKVRAAFPDKALEILSIAESSQISGFWWFVCGFWLVYLTLLHGVARLKIHHDENIQAPKT